MSQYVPPAYSWSIVQFGVGVFAHHDEDFPLYSAQLTTSLSKGPGATITQGISRSGTARHWPLFSTIGLGELASNSAVYSSAMYFAVKSRGLVDFDLVDLCLASTCECNNAVLLHCLSVQYTCAHLLLPLRLMAMKRMC
jgi:hypothetical protein